MKNKEITDKAALRRGARVFVGGIGFSALVIIWFLWGHLSPNLAGHFIHGASNEQVTRAGTWGDSYGPFNAFISACAFASVVATLLLQSESIKNQEVDTHRQRFEASFFELIRLMKELRSGISFQNSDEYYFKKNPSYAPPPGKKRIRKEYSNIKAIQQANREIVHWLIDGNIASNPSRNEIVNIYMRRIHSKSEATLAPYFRLIYTILNRIKSDTVLSDHEKEYYGNLLRSQLTSYETTLLAINALSPVAKDLSNLIVYFRMLKYLPDGKMKMRLAKFYPPETFMAREGP